MIEQGNEARQVQRVSQDKQLCFLPVGSQSSVPVSVHRPHFLDATIRLCKDKVVRESPL